MIQTWLNAKMGPCVALSSGQGQQETSCKAAHPQSRSLSHSCTRDVDYYWCLLTVEKKPKAWYVAETTPSPPEPRGGWLVFRASQATLAHSRLSADRAVWMAYTSTTWQNARASLLNLHIHCWSECSGSEPHGEIEKRSSPGLLLYSGLFFESRTDSALLDWRLHLAHYRINLVIFMHSNLIHSFSEDLNCSFMSEGQIWIHSWIRSDVPFLL